MWTLTQRRKLFAPIGALIVARAEMVLQHTHNWSQTQSAPWVLGSIEPDRKHRTDLKSHRNRRHRRSFDSVARSDLDQQIAVRTVICSVSALSFGSEKAWKSIHGQQNSAPRARGELCPTSLARKKKSTTPDNYIFSQAR